MLALSPDKELLRFQDIFAIRQQYHQNEPALVCSIFSFLSTIISAAELRSAPEGDVTLQDSLLPPLSVILQILAATTCTSTHSLYSRAWFAYYSMLYIKEGYIIFEDRMSSVRKFKDYEPCGLLLYSRDAKQ